MLITLKTRAQPKGGLFVLRDYIPVLRDKKEARGDISLSLGIIKKPEGYIPVLRDKYPVLGDSKF